MLPFLFVQQSAALLHQSERAEPGRGGEAPGVYMLCRCSHLAQSTLDCRAKGCLGGGVMWGVRQAVQKSVCSCSCHALITHQSSYSDGYITTSRHRMAPKQTALLDNETFSIRLTSVSCSDQLVYIPSKTG